MKKPTAKRLGLGLLQHLAAMFLLIAIAGILFNSFLAVDTMNGTKVYSLSPMDAEPEFEDSTVFREIFQTAAEDIICLVVIKEQVETDGLFDPDKCIDITKFAEQNGRKNGCTVTAEYALEDLIKWGKYGIEYTNRAMSMSDFVNYFGPATAADNFALDESGELCFVGFQEGASITDGEKTTNNYNAKNNMSNDSSSQEEGITEEQEKVLTELEVELQKKTEEQLEDLAFSYILANTTAEIRVTKEDDGSYTVYFPMIQSRYNTVDDEKQLVAYADNWVDYMKLQENLAETITSLANNYQLYQKCNDLYLENSSNLKYVVRMKTEDGVQTYTNVAEMSDMEESEITDYFSEYRRYLIYYPDSLEFTGNTSMTEDEIYHYLTEYEYAHPETTHIWLAVDTGYPLVGDAFYKANEVFQRIVPNIRAILIFGGVMGVLWLTLAVYLTLTAGVTYNENDERVLYLDGIDHIWTELLVLLCAALVFGGYLGSKELLKVAEGVYVSHSMVFDTGLNRLNEYSTFAAFGYLSSMGFGIVWYSFVRRLRNRNLWKESFVHWVLSGLKRGFRFVVSHRNTAVSTLIPYNMFILANLLGIVCTYILRNHGNWWILTMVALVVLDSVVGVAIFRHKAEQLDIVDGIKRIRDGEVEYKLEVENLHGDNREMADAVNNIGEGIRNAVRTSMKDEQMKTDLITNVSHDIKTPLTSIVNYVDLLKRLKITEEPAKNYIEILDTKSQRLKQLTDDLVEASKISSGNIELKREKLNLAELLHQAIGEFSDKLEDKQLTVIFDGSEQTANIYADSRRMWRIIENLFNNICKYAMETTRVYVDLVVNAGYIEVSLKNISERQMNIKSDDLTERFIRGDSSRTTEGSGLGLYIAKSLTQAQQGEFVLQLDGDLFKVLLRFPEYVEPEMSGAEKTEDIQDVED